MKFKLMVHPDTKIFFMGYNIELSTIQHMMDIMNFKRRQFNYCYFDTSGTSQVWLDCIITLICLWDSLWRGNFYGKYCSYVCFTEVERRQFMKQALSKLLHAVEQLTQYLYDHLVAFTLCHSSFDLPVQARSFLSMNISSLSQSLSFQLK